MRAVWGAAIAIGLVAVLGLGTAAATDADLSLHFQQASGNVTIEDPGGHVIATDVDPPDRYRFQLDRSEDYRLVNATIAQGFPALDRGRQLVPYVDGHHLVEVDDPAQTQRSTDVFNVSTREDGWAYQLGLAGPGETELAFERDIEPPAIELVSVGNHTDVGFDVTTDTSEAARAELTVENTEGETLQTYPTNRPGPWQHFPVQGLDANTTYVVEVAAWDWSGNTATTEPVEVTTEPEEDPVKPTVQPVRPRPNETVGPNTVVVEAVYTQQGWPIVEEEVKVFFDKEPVDRSAFEVGEGSVTYRPETPLEERRYFVSVEVPNTAGGVGVARWSFHVEEDAGRPAPAPTGLLALVLGAGGLALARRDP